MKTIGKISLILAIIFFASMIMAIITGLYMIFPGFESASINQSEKISSSGINVLSINNVPSPDIHIYPIKGNEFKIDLTGSYAKNDLPAPVNLTVSKKASTLNVGISQPQFGIIIINQDFHLEVGVPENFFGDVSVTSVSGEINAENIKVSSFSGKSTSGNIYLKNIVSQKTTLESVSGEIEADSSENIIFLKTTSGQIELENYLVNNDVSIESVSGDIVLRLLPESSVNVAFDSVSGDLRNTFGEINSGNFIINARTVSGEMTIEKANP